MENFTPRQLSNELMKLSDQFSKLSEAFAGYLKVQADYFVTNRPNHKSDTSTQRAFETTEAGVNMSVLRVKIKSNEKKMSAIKTRLRLLETEGRNIY